MRLSTPSRTRLRRPAPSTAKQKNLGALLARELQEMGIRDAHLDEHGYVYATIPSNTGKPLFR